MGEEHYSREDACKALTECFIGLIDVNNEQSEVDYRFLIQGVSGFLNELARSFIFWVDDAYSYTGANWEIPRHIQLQDGDSQGAKLLKNKRLDQLSARIVAALFTVLSASSWKFKLREKERFLNAVGSFDAMAMAFGRDLIYSALKRFSSKGNIQRTEWIAAHKEAMEIVVSVFEKWEDNFNFEAGLFDNSEAVRGMAKDIYPALKEIFDKFR